MDPGRENQTAIAGGLIAPQDERETFVVSHQRARMLRALAEEVVAVGYRSTTVAAIVKSAGVARSTFYDNFANKEACFLAACELAGEEGMRRISEAVQAAPSSWARRVRAGIGAFLGFVIEEPALARLFLVESPSAGAAAGELYERTVRAVLPMFRIGRRCAKPKRLPATLEETVVGGLIWIVYQRIATGRPEGLAGIEPELVEFALTPYLGAPTARLVAEE